VPRPRLPSNVLELRGAFKKHPERRRQDPAGAAEFKREPPPHLPQGAVSAWRYLVERLPKVAITSSDEIAVEVCAGLLAKYWLSSELDTLKELRQWLGKLGMTPGDRARLPSAPPDPQNPYSAL